MKLKYILTALFAALCCTMWGQTSDGYTPVIPTAGNQYLIYNVGSQKYLCVDAEGNTSTSDTENSYTISDGSKTGLYNIKNGDAKQVSYFQGLLENQYTDLQFTLANPAKNYYTLASRELETNAFSYLYDSEVTSSVEVTASRPNSVFTRGMWQFFDPKEFDDCILPLTDGSYTLTKGTYKTGNVTYTRSAAASGSYATYCLPFDINVSDVLGEERPFQVIYTPVSTAFYNTETGMLRIHLETVESGTIPAGTAFMAQLNTDQPVTLKSNSIITYQGNDTYDGTNVQPEKIDFAILNLSSDASNIGTLNTDITLQWCGSIAPVTADPDHMLSFKTNGNFGVRTSTSDFPAFRAYLLKNAGSGVKGITLDIFDEEEEATGIQQLEESATNDDVYNVRGQKMGNDINQKTLPRGVYIVNGKKILK